MALQGKRALVTGASRGVGEAIAKRYAKEGASLILTAQTEDKLKQVAEACKSAGAKEVEVYPLDLSDLQGVDKLAQTLIEKHKVIDVLVNNAGVTGIRDTSQPNLGQGPFGGDPEEWAKVYQINVLAPMRLVRLLGPAMVKKGAGAIINISSIAGTMGEAANPAYSTSKNAMSGWSEALHENLAPKGIKVVVIQPAAIATPMTLDSPAADFDPEKEIQTDDIARIAVLPFELSQYANIKELVVSNMVPPMKEGGVFEKVKQAMS